MMIDRLRVGFNAFSKHPLVIRPGLPPPALAQHDLCRTPQGYKDFNGKDPYAYDYSKHNLSTHFQKKEEKNIL